LSNKGSKRNSKPENMQSVIDRAYNTAGEETLVTNKEASEPYNANMVISPTDQGNATFEFHSSMGILS